MRRTGLYRSGWNICFRTEGNKKSRKASKKKRQPTSPAQLKPSLTTNSTHQREPNPTKPNPSRPSLSHHIPTQRDSTQRNGTQSNPSQTKPNTHRITPHLLLLALHAMLHAPPSQPTAPTGSHGAGGGGSQSDGASSQARTDCCRHRPPLSNSLLHYSTTPPFHYFTTPLLHYSTISLLHYCTTSPFHYSTTALLQAAEKLSQNRHSTFCSLWLCAVLTCERQLKLRWKLSSRNNQVSEPDSFATLL